MYNRTDSENPSERFKIVHISDAHLSDKSSDNYYLSPNNLLEAVRFANQPELKINALLSTGDHISDNKNKTSAFLFMKSFFDHLYADNIIPTFPCYGNHDSNMGGNKDKYLNQYDLYTAFNNKQNYTLKRQNRKNYYYADVLNPQGGNIRIIALDMLDQEGNDINTLENVVFSQDQMNWLGNIALKEGMTNLHNVIIITHYPFQPRWGAFLCDGDYVHSWKMVPEIVEAFRTKQSLKKTYSSQKEGINPIDIDLDFSSTPGDFICYLGGHAHITAQFLITGLSNQSEELPKQNMLLCTNMSPSEIGKVYNKVDRQSVSLTNNSFCIYAIDTHERNIYVTFFGAYLPKTLTQADYPDIQSFPY